MDKLTFKQYIESKDQLLAAIQETPIHTIRYLVKNYCKLVVGESKDNKVSIPLKPSNTIYVQWTYEDINNPTPMVVTFDGVRDTLNESEYQVYWTGIKLKEWLKKNAIEKNGLFNK